MNTETRAGGYNPLNRMTMIKLFPNFGKYFIHLRIILSERISASSNQKLRKV